jgi:hypothetical protein
MCFFTRNFSFNYLKFISFSKRGLLLNPPEVLLGCHKTQANQTKRYLGSANFDELAFWKRRLNDTELPYFLGGYSKRPNLT